MFYVVVQIRRGCVSDLNGDELKQCVLGNGRQCRLCEGTNCNQKIKPQQCIQCNSETSINCLNSPKMVPLLECQYYNDKCITIYNNQTVVRDCLHNLESNETFCEENPWHCHICETEGCNFATSTDKICYECDSKRDAGCVNGLDDSMKANCPYSTEYPGCFHYVNSTGMFLTLLSIV